MRQDTNAKFRNILRADFLIGTLFIGVGLLFAPAPATATVIFQDDFNTGTITKKLNGVSFWINGSQDAPDTYATSPSDIFIQAEERGGSSLRVLYVGTPDPLGDARPQLNFELGSSTYPELWVSFKVYIPQNYVHRVPSGTGNNKFFIIDNNIGSQYIDLEVWPRGDGSDKVSFNSKYNGVAQGHIFPPKDWTLKKRNHMNGVQEREERGGRDRDPTALAPDSTSFHGVARGGGHGFQSRKHFPVGGTQ